MITHPVSDLEFVFEIRAHDVVVPDFEKTVELLRENRLFIREGLRRGHAYYFSGFPLTHVQQFRIILDALEIQLGEYSGAKVRIATNESDRLYVPTSTPGFRKNFLHNELAYQRDVPEGIVLFCEQQSPTGGESLLGDQRQVYNSIDPNFMSRLEKRKLRFVRCLINQTAWHKKLSQKYDFMAIFPSWQNNLATLDKDEAQEICEKRGFEVTWTKTDDLVIARVMDPVRSHPHTKEPMWVNNSHLFQLHKGVYGPWLYALFKSYFSFSPRVRTQCYYGDGEPIEAEVISDIIAATNHCERALRLQPGDFVLAHNHAIGHGRRTFKGHRRLYFGVAMNL